jgi:tryptophanyl-tRNA synthetase
MTSTNSTTEPNTSLASRPRVLTGDRPTGRLHLGHYVGSLVNRVAFQRQYESFFIVADLHLLTTQPERSEIEQIGARAREIVLDSLSAGVEPDETVFYLQSGVPEVCVLNTLFQSLVTVSRLERIPSLKEMARSAGRREMSYALLGYPVLQSADVLCVRANAVPVGGDNQALIEVTQEIARRFNHLYGETLPVPEPILSETPVLVGTDGQAKMSKSLDNAIYLADDQKTVRRKVMAMFTDPSRISADVPADPDNGNPVFVYHGLFNDDRAEVAELKERYRRGAVGDVEVKESLAEALDRFLTPMRERRAIYETASGYVEELLLAGTERVRGETHETLTLVTEAMGLSATLKRIRRKVEQSRR